VAEVTELFVFTLYPTVILVATIGLSCYEVVYRLEAPKLLLVPVVLFFMLVHQFTEVITFLETASIQSRPFAETFETAANTFAAVGVYYGVHLIQQKDALASQLETSERQYRTLTENSPLPILVLDDGAVAFANGAATGLFGTASAASLEGEPLREFVHPEDRESFEAGLASLREGARDVRTFEHRVRGADGEQRRVVVAGGCGSYEGEEALYLVLRDVTKEREYEEGLERARERFQTTLDSSNDAIFLIDPEENTILEANRSAAELLDYEPGDLVGMSTEHIHPHEYGRFEEFQRTVVDEENVRTDELSCLTRQGKQIPVEVSASKIETEQGPAILAAARDISDRRRRRQQINVLRRILRHNLRNEMTVVIGNAEVLEEEVETERLRTAAASIRERSESLVETSRQVRDLEQFIRQGAQRQEAVDLVPALREVVSSCREAHPRARIETDFPATARSIGGEAIGWAVEHLVENAVEHNPAEEPWVRVRAQASHNAVGHEYVDLVVEDDGPGIAESELAAVDTDVEQTPVRHGSGIGLHTVSQVVDILGGEMEITDRAAGGSRIRLRLPAGENGTATAVAHSD